MFKKTLYFVMPVFTLVLGNILVFSFLLPRFESREAKALVGASFGLGLFIILLKMVSWLARYAGISQPRLGGLNASVVGLVVGLGVSLASGTLFQEVNQRSFDQQIFFQKLSLSMLIAVSPATVEEATFRYGVVHGTAVLAGPVWAGVAGSIPFAFGHLIDLAFGRTISAAQIWGIVLAGLLLSVLYLQFGLLAAIGCHWVWNSLASPWVYGLSLPVSSGISDFEGAWTTDFVLLIAITILVAWGSKSKRDLRVRQQ